MALSGKLVSGGIVAVSALAAVGLYYSQVYAYYDTVTLGDGSLADGQTRIQIETLDGTAVALDPTGFSGINGSSSPIRFRACMTLSDPAAVIAAATPAPDAEPLTAPGWFDCYDAVAIGGDLQAGAAMVVLSEANIVDGIDRLLAIYPDGRAFAWHQLNPSLNK